MNPGESVEAPFKGSPSRWTLFVSGRAGPSLTPSRTFPRQATSTFIPSHSTNERYRATQHDGFLSRSAA